MVEPGSGVCQSDSDVDEGESEQVSGSSGSPSDLSLSCSFSPFESDEVALDGSTIEPYQYEPECSSDHEDSTGDEEEDEDTSRLLSTDWYV